MTVETFISGSGDWTVPAGITSVDIELWGAGGGGSGGDLVEPGGGGGGGGYCKKNALSVTPGQLISYVVGNKGIGQSGDIGTDGGNSTANSGEFIGGGGGGAAIASIGTGGISTGGDINTTGGNGTYSGGSVGGVGGDGAAGGGTGGLGGSGVNPGGSGNAPGGGGGGSGDGSDLGGDGANGQVTFTYGTPTPPSSGGGYGIFSGENSGIYYRILEAA